jgi:hypothetical protein
VGKSEGKKQFGRKSHRWENNIRVDIKEILVEYEDRNRLAENRAFWRSSENMVLNSGVP